jgi:hypothetical protein
MLGRLRLRRSAIITSAAIAIVALGVGGGGAAVGIGQGKAFEPDYEGRTTGVPEAKSCSISALAAASGARRFSG